MKFLSIVTAACQIQASLNVISYNLKFKQYCGSVYYVKKLKYGNLKKKIATDKELISKIYKQLTQLNDRKTNNPTIKWGKGLNRHFSEEDIQMANKHMKRCSTSLIIREMQIKATMRYHLTLVRWPSSTSQQTINAGEGMEKREHSCTVGGNVN